MRTVEDLPLVIAGQQSLFDLEPPKRPESSQWWSPPALAKRAAAWIPRGARVLEPSCGSGNLIAALLELGHDPSLITGIEMDPQWAEHARKRFDGRVHIVCGDALAILRGEDELGLTGGTFFEAALTNPPYERALHAAFVEALVDARIKTVVGILPHSIEYGLERDRLWREKARVVRRARLPGRVSYGGDFSASFETVVLRIEPRTMPRGDGGEIVVEDVWSL